MSGSFVFLKWDKVCKYFDNNDGIEYNVRWNSIFRFIFQVLKKWWWKRLNIHQLSHLMYMFGGILGVSVEECMRYYQFKFALIIIWVMIWVCEYAFSPSLVLQNAHHTETIILEYLTCSFDIPWQFLEFLNYITSIESNIIT